MDYLEVGVGDLGVGHKVLQDVAVLDLGHSEDCVPSAVVLLHGGYHLGHVAKFLLVLGLSPLVGAIGEILIVVLAIVVDCVEEILKVIEADDIALARLYGGAAHPRGHVLLRSVNRPRRAASVKEWQNSEKEDQVI